MKLFQILLLLLILFVISCSSIPSSGLLSNSKTTRYIKNGPLSGATYTFYNDSTYHYDFWTDDMFTCIDSGKFSFSNNVVSFRSVYLSEKRNYNREHDTCRLTGFRCFLDSNRLYDDKKDGTIDKKKSYTREDILEKEKEERRNSNSNKLKRSRIIPE